MDKIMYNIKCQSANIVFEDRRKRDLEIISTDFDILLDTRSLKDVDQ